MAMPGGGGGARRVGVVGLGTMGGAMAGHLIDAGFRVTGVDVDPEARRRLEARGGRIAKTPAELQGEVEVVLLSLPSVAAFEAVVGGPGGLVETAEGTGAAVVVETSTLPLDRKEWARELLAAAGCTLLDCPISGTGAQMAERDVVYYASGDPEAIEIARPFLAACGREVFDLGAFGNGTRLKLIANHLVAVHNAASAEAMLLVRALGIDPGRALAGLTAGAGTSRILELRGPLMAEGRYEPATMKVEVFQKDVDIIAGLARELRCPLPVFAAAAQLNLAALAMGMGTLDTACLHAVLAAWRRQ
jgi:putative dehydrogenase